MRPFYRNRARNLRGRLERAFKETQLAGNGLLSGPGPAGMANEFIQRDRLSGPDYVGACPRGVGAGRGSNGSDAERHQTSSRRFCSHTEILETLLVRSWAGGRYVRFSPPASSLALLNPQTCGELRLVAAHFVDEPLHVLLADERLDSIAERRRCRRRVLVDNVVDDHRACDHGGSRSPSSRSLGSPPVRPRAALLPWAFSRVASSPSRPERIVELPLLLDRQPLVVGQIAQGRRRFHHARPPLHGPQEAEPVVRFAS